jgi:hypothetical protein
VTVSPPRIDENIAALKGFGSRMRNRRVLSNLQEWSQEWPESLGQTIRRISQGISEIYKEPQQEVSGGVTMDEAGKAQTIHRLGQNMYWRNRDDASVVEQKSKGGIRSGRVDSWEGIRLPSFLNCLRDRLKAKPFCSLKQDPESILSDRYVSRQQLDDIPQ